MSILYDVSHASEGVGAWISITTLGQTVSAYLSVKLRLMD